MRLAIAAAAMMVVSYAQAADIKLVQNLDVEGGSFIFMSGPLVPSDWPNFVAATKDVPEGKGTLILSGPGGNTFTAIRIGNMLHQKGWNTRTEVDTFCASACGLIWLAGQTRVIDLNSRVGFHASYVKQGSDNVEKGAPNALVGAYLARLGFSYEAIDYVTEASPDNLTWINQKDAEKYGIPYHQVLHEASSNVPMDINPAPFGASGERADVLGMAAGRVKPPLVKNGMPFGWIQ